MIWYKNSIVLLFCLLFANSMAQQITVDNTVSAQDLVENTLIQGCVEVSNISSPVNGSVDNIGSFAYFEQGTSNFPFQNGIILSTGNANSAGNGENTNTLNEGTSAWPTDPDLESALAISGTLNATSLEFEFISTTNQIQFNYILASEEYYANFPCEYSDGFALLIRLAGTNDPFTNIAVIPGTNTPVNTNTIHNEIVGFCPAENEEYFDGFNMGDTNYNGRTTVLTASATITPNVAYQIKMIIADQTDQNYDSAVFIEGNSFDTVVDLGEDISICAEEYALDGDIENPQATYSWFFNGGLIPGAIQPTYDATQTGNYRVEISIPLAGGFCIIEDDVDVVLSATQASGPISDYELCDDQSNDNIETFDLNTKTNEVEASVPPSSYAISYHYSANDAQNNINAIANPIQNSINPQTIFVRIEDTSTGCLAYNSFNLVVNQYPIPVDPSLLSVCDDSTADGITDIDLSVKDSEITNGQPNLVVSYHPTPNDALNGTNTLPNPYTNSSPNETVYVRVTNTITGCSSTTTLDISVTDNPVINREDHYIDACDVDHNGFASFDLTQITADVLQGLTNVTVTFHETPEDAEAGINSIPDPSNYSNSMENEQIVFIRVEDNATGCSTYTPIEIHTNLLLTGTSIRDFTLCDIDNDGTEEFSFASIALVIINGLEDVTVTFYETENERDNQINAIDPNTPYQAQSNPQTIYIELNSPDCSEVAEFDLIMLPINQFDSIGSVTVCDDDQDGITTTILSDFDAQVTGGDPNFSVTYFISESDANSNSNPLPNTYTNSTNPFVLYPRIVENSSGCADSSGNEFTVDVLPAPETNTPDPLIICDDDQDARSIVNLDALIPNVVSDTTDRSITFHSTQEDAVNNTAAIPNSNAYDATTETVFIRVENTNTSCYSVESLDIIVNTLPIFQPINNYRVCENQSDGFANFMFNTMDAEILNGQTGKQVLYFLTEIDATNRTNAIDKTSNYQNVTNPQTIYTRVENNTDQDCFGTSSFIIEVGSNPNYNEPSDWFMCDDNSNDSTEIFDLSTKITEIESGIPEDLTITFYSSLSDAQSGTNPLPLQYENTSNPEEIFVLIDNGTICTSTTSFTLNIVQVPALNEPSPLVECDNDGNGSTLFDLTEAEVEILDVRQDDIEIAYFTSMNDVENNTNAIANPSSFMNTVNPQTVFFKVTNTISNCYSVVPIDLIVELPPQILYIADYEICDTENNTYDLSEINTAFTPETGGISFSYYSSSADAHQDVNEVGPIYNYQTTSDQLYVRVSNDETLCYRVHPFNLVVNPTPSATQPNDMYACDDDYDGYQTFDFSTQNAAILNGQAPSQYSVTYFNSFISAQEGVEPLGDVSSVAHNSTIYARVQNNATGCFSITQFGIVVYPKPVVEIPDQVICLENLPLVVSAETNDPSDSYLWSTGETTPEIIIPEVGSYWVSVTTENGCETTDDFNVDVSEVATIEFTETIDFSDPNNITIEVSGIGDYQYILDDGFPQESNVFENVSLGYHTITVFDAKGCSSVSQEVVVIDAPKYFTPNNDGQHDTWHISGVETLPGTVVYIFDRFGKLIKQIGSNTPGWNGTYNGNNMPSSDYWFVAEVKNDGETFKVTGHFTLKR
ncbi:MAG: T9SS type B sorting domain-containing protein [Bacteroidia bacterium]|nr:T9SS type B sorting domain-containing protein [Bacteroidia bacterium]